MAFLTSLIGSIGIVTVGVTCLIGLAFLVVLGIVVAGIIWGARKGKLRVVTGERNFDNFGH